MTAPFSPQDCAALRRELESLADPAYKTFNESLLPGVETAYGIRLPQMRQVAKALLRQDPSGFLEHFQPNCYEETQLRGPLLAGAAALGAAAGAGAASSLWGLSRHWKNFSATWGNRA